MRFRILVTTVAIAGVALAATITLRGSASASLGLCCVESHDCCKGGSEACCKTSSKTSSKQWTSINFMDTVLVKNQLVTGPVLIVHDDEKMAKGEPCTTFYRLDPTEGPKEELVSFHCVPRRAPKPDVTKLSTSPTDLGVKRLTEYQIAGDPEAHGVPAR